MKYFAGIGSRNTPPDICQLMTKLAEKLSEQSFILRSGGAQGADTAFQEGTKDAIVWLPWVSFAAENQKKWPHHTYRVINPNDPAALEALRFHPAPDKLSRGAKLCLMRNYYQVKSYKGEPDSSFVVCWTPGGELVGGTAFSIRLAAHYGIRVFNLAKKDDLERIVKFIA